MDDDIKSRFKESKSVVELLASNTWNNVSQTYQRANQKLLAKEEMLRDDFLRDVRSSPLRVRDVIPESRLARYCNSEYGEWEECNRGSGKLSVFCSCVKEEEDPEAWMLPEVEDAFVSLAYSPSVKEIELVQFQKSHQCKLPDKYPFYASFCGSGEDCKHVASEEELVEHKPVELTVETFEEMILRLKIRSDKVKHLWSPYSEENHIDSEKKIEQEVSSDWILDKCHVRRMDFSNLQCLSDTIRALKAHYFNLEKLDADLADSTPIRTRRLYSDVLREHPPPLVEEPPYSHTERAEKQWLEEPEFLMGPPPSSGSYTNFFENAPGSKNYSYCYGNAVYNPNLHNNYLHKELVYSNFYQHSSVSKQSFAPTWFAPTRNAPLFAPLPYLTPPTRPNQPYPMFYLRSPNVPTYHHYQNPQQWTQQFGTDPGAGSYAKLKTKPPPDASKRHVTYESATNKRLTVKPAPSTSSLGPNSDSTGGVLPVSSTLSEDLERQALEQYQNSDENLYRELEKQAEEQYDDDPMEDHLQYQYHLLRR